MVRFMKLILYPFYKKIIIIKKKEKESYYRSQTRAIACDVPFELELIGLSCTIL